MEMKPNIEDNVIHELGMDQLTQIERNPRMKEIRLLAWVLPLIALLLVQPNQATAQVFPEIAVSEQEITIPGDGTPVVIEDIALATPPLDAGFTTCIVTFNTELATSEGQQLAVLFYASGDNPPPSMCSLEAVAGPMLTQVNGGLDETHTFIGRTSFFVHESQAGARARIRPCMSSALGGAYRLRIHLLTLQCGPATPFGGLSEESTPLGDPEPRAE